MAFLTPFYLLAGAAIALPVLFHLIRQTPKGRQVFSSVMFLEPSPPRVSKRSRIEDWLLLILRGLAVLLLAIAFARPFLKSAAYAGPDEGLGKRIVILVDRSASMRRASLWRAAQAAIKDALDQLSDDASVALMVFDDNVQTLSSFSDWKGHTESLRQSMILDNLRQVEPSWTGTDLSKALKTAADLLVSEGEQPDTRQLIVISDFQTGSKWEALNTYQWPENLLVEMVQLEVNKPTNVGIQSVANSSLSDAAIRVRISNDRDSKEEEFQLHWQDEFSTEPSLSKKNGTTVYVPPGQSRVVHAPPRPEANARNWLRLVGDEHDFDNICYVANSTPWKVKILFVGHESADGAESLQFFLPPLYTDTPKRSVEVIHWDAVDELPDIAEEQITMVIFGGQLNSSQTEWGRDWLQSGGKGIFVATNTEQANRLGEILDLQSVAVEESVVPDYAMLRSVDLTHPVFEPFNDPRFADFSKVRFWKHRAFDLASIPNSKPLATFESGAPAIFEVPNGQGKLIVFTSGWSRSDSDLAVWSKFVPMMNGFLDYFGERIENSSFYYVGDNLNLSDYKIDSDKISLRTPTGESLTLGKSETYSLAVPGYYIIEEMQKDGESRELLSFAVNVPPEESKTAQVELEQFVAAGVPMTPINSDEIKQPLTAHEKRQLLNRELEEKQQIWKWLLSGAIFFLLLETGLAAFKRPALS